jgi:hypothetical protein
MGVVASEQPSVSPNTLSPVGESAANHFRLVLLNEMATLPDRAEDLDVAGLKGEVGGDGGNSVVALPGHGRLRKDCNGNQACC